MNNNYSGHGKRASIIRTGDDVVLRVYKNKGEFVDLDIFHNDLNIIIDDEDSMIYETSDDEGYIDHHPRTYYGTETYEEFAERRERDDKAKNR